MSALTNVRSRQQWAEIINADWRKSISGIIQTGSDIIAAKGELQPAEFTQMVENDLLFSRITAENLMRVAKHPEIAKCSSTNTLPPSWAVLNELSRLTPADFRDAVEKGLVSTTTSLRHARSVHEAYSRPEGVIGENRSPSALPTPTEARDIARATNRFVAASDGKIYSGASAEEEGEYSSRRREVFGIREAIERIADHDKDAFAWFEGVERHWLHDFRLSAVDDAIEWLTSLKSAMGVIEHA